VRVILLSLLVWHLANPLLQVASFFLARTPSAPPPRTQPLASQSQPTAFAAKTGHKLSAAEMFEIDTSLMTSEDAVRRHAGRCNGDPEVQVVRQGEEGLYAARSTLRVAVPAYELFCWLTDPDKNAQIFAKRVVRVNQRTLVKEDKRAETRLFEVTKTGKFRLLGIPLEYESTVMALEDWRDLEIRFWQIRPGVMRHSAGFWRIIPTGPSEAVVLFFSEAVPSFELPSALRPFAARIVRDMAGGLLEDLRDAVLGWDGRPLTWRP